MVPNMALLVPLTQLSSTAPTLSQPGANDAVLDKTLTGLPLNLKARQQAQLQSASLRIQNQAVKTLIDVVVKEQKTLNADQRGQLSQQFKSNSLNLPSSVFSSIQGKQQANTPQTLAATEIATLKHILAKPTVFLTKLQVGTKIQWALTPEKLATGKSLSVSVDSSNRWLANYTPTQAAPEKTIIAKAIRESLPQATNVSTTLKALQALQTKAEHLGLTLPSAIKTANQNLQNLTSPLQDLKQADRIETILRHSGGTYETKIADLASLLKTPLVPANNVAKLSNNSAFDKILLNFFVAKKTQTKQPSNQVASTIRQTQTASNSIAKDIKAQLIVLKQIADTFLKSNPTTDKQPPLPNKSTDQSSTKPQAEPNPRPTSQLNEMQATAQRKVVQQIQQQALAALAKIQLQQAQSLLHTNAQDPTSRTPNTFLQFEIPVQTDNDLHSLHIKIEQDWIDKLKQQEQEDDQQESHKVRRWQVNLQFELPKLGQFYARITQIDDSTKVQFWAEHSETLKKAQTRLEQLKQQLQHKGIHVEDIVCEAGIPAARNNKINCSLVDVCT